MTTHVVFGDSAAASLRKALAILDRDERVLVLNDDRSLGPIDPGAADQRAQWFSDILFDDVSADTARESDAAWTEAVAVDNITAWVSLRCGTELFGLSELVRRRGDTPTNVIDISAHIKGWEGGSFQTVTDDLIVEQRLIEHAAELSEFQRARLLAKWDELRIENDAVRLIEGDGPVSYPVEFLDDELVENATDEWVAAPRLVGEVLSGGADRLRFVAATTFVISRVLTLLDEGILEADSDESELDWSTLRVRRPGQDN